MLIIVYYNHPLTDHVVERGVIAAREEVGEEVHHHQPVLLSLRMMRMVRMMMMRMMTTITSPFFSA